MNGRTIGLILVGTALVAGAAMYWLQVYAFYRPATLAAEGGRVELRVAGPDGARPLAASGFEGIDAESSPIRFRACFRIAPEDVSGALPYPNATPLNAPGWFSCFDAGRIGADLAAGRASAYLGEANVTYGIDRVLAVYPDGRAYAWHQINACGEEVFDGRPPPPGCPPAPQG